MDIAARHIWIDDRYFLPSANMFFLRPMRKADKRRQPALHFSPVLLRRKLIDETTGSAQFATAASRELKGLLEKCTSRPFQDVQVTFHLFRTPELGKLL